MVARAFQERIVQGVCLEFGGLVIAAPLFATILGVDLAESALLIVAMALVEVVWTPLHNLAFDSVEWRCTGRLASDRSTCLRLVHAVTHEVSAIAVTLPVIMVIGGHGVREALMIDLGFSAFYVAYVFAFYLTYDRLRPLALPA